MKDVIKEVERYIRNLFSKVYLPGHDWLHTCRVRNLALLIAEDFNVNKLALELAALFHDVGRIEDDEKHAIMSAKIARDFLKDFNLRDNVLDIVVKSIEEHDSIKEPTYLEGKILQDADKLDGMGAIGLIRVAETAVFRRMKEYDEKNPFGIGFNGSLEDWINENLKEIPNRFMRIDKYIVEEIIGKEMQWINMLWTEKAKKIAIRRFDFTKEFLYNLFEDLKESGVI